MSTTNCPHKVGHLVLHVVETIFILNHEEIQNQFELELLVLTSKLYDLIKPSLSEDPKSVKSVRFQVSRHRREEVMVIKMQSLQVTLELLIITSPQMVGGPRQPEHELLHIIRIRYVWHPDHAEVEPEKSLHINV